LKVKTVTYSQLFSFGRFQNETIGYTAELEQKENPDQVLEELRQKTILQHHMNQQARDEGKDIRFIKRVERDSRNELDAIRDRFIRLQAGLSDLGVEVGVLDGLRNSIQQYEARLDEMKTELREKLEVSE